MKYNLPSKYLSYSAIMMWEKDKEQYRKIYYEKAPRFNTVYSKFGKKVHKLIEDGKLEVKDHPYDVYTSELKIGSRPSDKDYPINIFHINDVPVLGYIDLIDEKKYRLSDIKTSKNKWTDSMVQKLDQLPFYQLLVKEKFGKVNQWASVVWLETEWQEKKKGIGVTRNLALTGRQEVFHRRSNKQERDRLRELIVRVAGEVSEDYNYWLKNKTHE